MKKIPNIFKKDPNDLGRVIDVINPSCAWVFNEEGVATRKYDGTACLVKDGKLFKRRQVKKGKQIPVGFIEADFDENTGKRFGWIRLDANDYWHREAILTEETLRDLPDGTYELIGPKINSNPENKYVHMLINHKIETDTYPNVPRSFDKLGVWLSHKDIEGLVFHHTDGRMAKITKRNFGMERWPKTY